MREVRTTVLTPYLYVSLDFGAKLIKVLYNGAVDCSPEISVLISDDFRLVADPVIDVLQSY